jgi:tRNA A-37 threonylcarbamoyl transferase component Bud32
MNPVDTDRNLLFAVLALQNGFIDQPDLIAAFHDWSADRSRTLGHVLLDRRALSAEDHALVGVLLRKHLERHGGDAHASLAAAADGNTRDVLRRSELPEVRATLSTLPPAAGYVLIETLAPPSGQAPRSRYTLTRLHAEGGLGKVWVAHDADLNREVALKEIRPEKSAQPEMWRRFLKEAQVTGQLEHPNIVPVYELARRKEDDQPFYTMRFVRGRTLREAIEAYHARRKEGQTDPLEQPRLLQAFVSVCQALAYAHTRGVVHRDLKPENIVLGGFGEVVVLDWGLAKMVDRLDADGEAPRVTLSDQATTTGTVGAVGTVAYMSPEQAEGRTDLVDARTDVYGLGSILFEILAGRPPHTGTDTAEVLREIAHGDSPRARSVEPAAPAALDAICARAMAKARSDRYATATELAEEVQRWLADEPVRAFPEGLSRRLARWARHNRARAQAAVGPS